MLGRKTEPTAETSEERRGFDAYDLHLGDIMRGERATLGKSLLDVQRELKIKANYIAAVENSDPSVFETPGFIAGYDRSYARYLGLDPEWAYERFCAESGFAGVEGLSGNSSTIVKDRPKGRASGEDAFTRPMAPFVPAGESLMSRVEPGAIGSFAVLIALIGAIGYGGWFVLQEVQRVSFAPVDQSPGLVSDMASFGVTEPETDSATELSVASAEIETPSAVALDRLYRPQALEVPVLRARDGPIASLDPQSIGSFLEVPKRELVIANVTPEAPALPVVPEVQVTEAVDPGIMLFAVRPAWVRVAAVDGTVLFEKILDTGESYRLPQSDQVPVLRAGNSGSLYFTVDGKTFGPVGEGTSVAKNVALGVEEIMSAYAQADLDADPVLAEVITAMAAASQFPAEEGLPASE
ncbi:MAG: DUF4115 domain-containing protein [Litoreibacter sp.]|nr:DUF4115 domain-containing protein [Litoreibacter sp.]